MLDGSHFTEIEFKKFIQAGFGNAKLHPIQLQELRRAFYGGLSTAAFNVDKKDMIISESKHFFENEARDFMLNALNRGEDK